MNKLISYGYIESGEKGTEKTIQKILDKIYEGTKDPVIILKAREIVRDSGAQDAFERARAIFKWIKRNIAYIKDPKGLELLRPARRILESRIGDCDEHTILAASLFRAAGLPVALKVISTFKNPNEYTHIYPLVKTNSLWFAADTTLKESYFGWEYPYRVKEKIIAIDERVDISEIGQVSNILKEIEKKIKEKVMEIYEEIKKRQEEDMRKAVQENILWWVGTFIFIFILANFLRR